MKKLMHILLICLTTTSISAQNYFLDFSDARFHEIIPLQTDSMYIEGGTQTREIAFEYDANHRIIMSRERRTEPAQNFEIRETVATTYSLNKTIIIETIESIAPSSNIFIIRTTQDSINGSIISSLGEIWNGTEWKANQKDSLIYDASHNLVERSSKQWDFVDNLWKDVSLQRLEYDAQGLLSVRRELGLNGTIADTTYYGEYFYTYNIDGRITGLISRLGFPPQNMYKETYVYDNTGNLDSLIFDNWNDVLQTWQPNAVNTLDDSPEQQTTITGKQYKLGSLSQWYLDSDAFFTSGPQVYTDQPAEVLTKRFNTNTNQLENYERLRTTYTDLTGGIIKGDFQRAFYSNANWQNVLHIEAWQRKPEKVGVTNPTNIKIAHCGLPNPMAIDDLPTYLPEIASADQLDLFSVDGKLVLSQNIAKREPLQNTLKNQVFAYWMVISDKTNIICAQKMILH